MSDMNTMRQGKAGPGGPWPWRISPVTPGMEVRAAAMEGPAPRSGGAPGDGGGGAWRWVLATEQPVMVWDWDRMDVVPEVLLMSGCRRPDRLPLLDSHSRSSVRSLLGSVDGMEIVAGELRGVVRLAGHSQARDTAGLISDGHLTDGSVGYGVDRSVWVPEGETVVVEGREFSGPVKVCTAWTVREFSLTPIGADTLAKVAGAFDGGYDG